MTLLQARPIARTAPLESGDRYTRAEFERRYELMPEGVKCELIEGVVYMASPVRAEFHGKQTAAILAWLGAYWAKHPEVTAADNATVRLDLENEPQPDACLWKTEGGTARLVDGYLEGPPELVVEVTASTASLDLHDKLRAYRRNGVQEYVVWRVFDGLIDWFRLQEGEYVRMEPDDRGVISSEVFPGLRLAAQALLDGDLAAVLAEQQG